MKKIYKIRSQINAIINRTTMFAKKINGGILCKEKIIN